MFLIANTIAHTGIKTKYNNNEDNDTVIEKDHLGDWSPEKDCC